MTPKIRRIDSGEELPELFVGNTPVKPIKEFTFSRNIALPSIQSARQENDNWSSRKSLQPTVSFDLGTTS